MIQSAHNVKTQKTQKHEIRTINKDCTRASNRWQEYTLRVLSSHYSFHKSCTIEKVKLRRMGATLGLYGEDLRPMTRTAYRIRSKLCKSFKVLGEGTICNMKVIKDVQLPSLKLKDFFYYASQKWVMEKYWKNSISFSSRCIAQFQHLMLTWAILSLFLGLECRCQIWIHIPAWVSSIFYKVITPYSY